MLGPVLLTWHNLMYYQTLMRGMRAAILEGRLQSFSEETRSAWTAQKEGKDVLF
jgi:queuine tRNA-ribosyltransferase